MRPSLLPAHDHMDYQHVRLRDKFSRMRQLLKLLIPLVIVIGTVILMIALRGKY